MSVYGIPYLPSQFNESIIVSTFVSMTGSDADKNEHNKYSKYLVLLIEEDGYYVTVVPVADDCTSEWETPWKEEYYYDRSEGISEYNKIVERALDGALE